MIMKYSSMLLSLLLLTLCARGQRFHAFLFCKTGDKDIGNSVIVNYGNMELAATKIADAMNMEYVEHAVTASNFNEEKVERSIENANVGKDDIVLVYFSTHGGKWTTDKDIFPELDIPNKLISAYEEHQKIAGKHPKILITVVEACSGYIDVTPQESFAYQQGLDGAAPEQTSDIQAKNIKRLFSGACQLIVTAGQPGKNTWATNDGSMFTNCFLRALNEYINMPENRSASVTWDNLLQQAKEYTWDMTSTTKIQYYPVWELTQCGGPSGLVPQSIVGAVKDRNVVFSIEKKRTLRVKNPYNIYLKVKYEPVNGITLDSVTYFLDKTFTDSIVTVYNRQEDFAYTLGVYGSFPLKAKAWFSDGRKVDLYGDFSLSDRTRLFQIKTVQ
jgi:hypothetical protein